jgi:2,4-diketo-3-deoxy-L-fuconate hydrolase
LVNKHSQFALGRFVRGQSGPFLGAVIEDTVTPVSQLDSTFSPDVTLRELLCDWPSNLAKLKAAVCSARAEGGVAMANLRACAPLPDARQVFCTGANYRRHVLEMVVANGAGPDTDGMDAEARRAYGEAYIARQIAESSPYVFMKTVTSISGPCDPLMLPDFSDKIDWEIELGAVIGTMTYKVPRTAALSCVAGYMIVNDLTARDRVRRTDPGAIGPDWVAAKGAPGFLPTGPYFVPAEFIANPHDLRMRLMVNGQTMQDDRTSDMTFDIARQIEFISSYARMLPGDILCTGSPAGNGVIRGVFLRDGDIMEAEIDGLGRQVVRCVGAAPTLGSRP